MTKKFRFLKNGTVCRAKGFAPLRDRALIRDAEPV
jgi:hypothetical protein